MDFSQNPFYLISVSTRDDRRRIISIAEEKCLTKDPDLCVKARSELTNPRNRLSAEIAWLPGVSPRRSISILKELISNPKSIEKYNDLFPLALANLIAAALLRINQPWKVDDLSKWFIWFSKTFELIDAESVKKVINEERSISGFPEVNSKEFIEYEINNRKRYYQTKMKEVLDKLNTSDLINVVTQTVELTTENGNVNSPILVDDLVDIYQVETQSFLEKEKFNILEFIEEIKQENIMSKGESIVIQLINKLCEMVRNWDKVAQPIQLSALSRGLPHEDSFDLAYKVRSFAIELFNNHGYSDSAHLITKMLQDVFAEIPEVSEKIDQDAETIENIIKENKEAAENYEKWIEEITYSARVGTLFKLPLWISADGIGYDNNNFKMEDITRVRWGGITEKSALFSTTNYKIYFGDDRKLIQVETKNQEVFTEFTTRLMKTVGFRIMQEMIDGLAGGQSYSFGETTLNDNGIELLKHKFVGADERVHIQWSDLAIGNGPGYFSISMPKDKKTYAKLYYLEIDNLHIFELAMRIFWKQPSTVKLSQIFQGN